MRTKNVLLTFCLTLLIATVSFGSGHLATVYVDKSVESSGDGSNWDNAYKYLQDGLAAAEAMKANYDHVVVKVAVGVYKPTESVENLYANCDRTATFNLIAGVKIEGGYVGNTADNACCCIEKDPDYKYKNIACCCECEVCDAGCDAGYAGCACDCEDGCELCDYCHPQTVLSGNICDPCDMTDNSYHVVTAVGPEAAGVLANVTVKYGWADGDNCDWAGGGGLYIEDSTPTIKSSCFVYNTAGRWGGAVSNNDADPLFIGVSFCDNKSFEIGGAVDNYRSHPQFYNCVWKDNQAQLAGGAVSNFDSRFDGEIDITPIFSINGPLFMNNTFYSNEVLDTAVGAGGAIYINGSTIKLYNSILWADSAAKGIEIFMEANNKPSYIGSCIIDGGQGAPAIDNDDAGPIYDGPISDADPLFVDAEGCNLRLQITSPAVDAADKRIIPLGLIQNYDRDCNQRVVNIPGSQTAEGFGICCPCNPDLGAYERKRVIFVDDTAEGAGNGYFWPDAYTDLQDALAQAEAILAGDVDPCDCVPECVEIWVAEGTYKPTDCHRCKDEYFALLNDVAIYGGFLGEETDKCYRDDHRLLPTYLSGDMEDNDYEGIDPEPFADNSWTIVYAGPEINNSAILDGFIITGGYANGTSTTHPEWNNGGGMYCLGSPVLRCNTFQDNWAYYDGGAIFVDGSGDYPGAPVIDTCTFIANECQANGGAIRNKRGDVLIKCSYFTNNIGKVNGAAVANTNGECTIVNTEFTNNGIGLTMTANPPFNVVGAQKFGGAVASVNTYLYICDSRFAWNLADDAGGALFNLGNPVTKITGSEFIGNEANDGGAMYNAECEVLDVYNSGLWFNLAWSAGGAIYNTRCGSNDPEIAPKLINVTVAENLVGAGVGCGLYTEGTPLSGNFDVDRRRPLFIGNAIFWGNEFLTGPEGDQIYMVNTDLVLNRCIIENGVDVNGITKEGTWTMDGAETVKVTDPLFADTDYEPFNGDEEYDFTPGVGSPAIDYGKAELLPECIHHDMAGNCRVYCDQVDLGAIETDLCGDDCCVLKGDFDGNGVVNSMDVLQMLSYLRNKPDREFPIGGDLDGNGTINSMDLLQLLSNLRNQ